jgi:hypothetical protein
MVSTNGCQDMLLCTFALDGKFCQNLGVATEWVKLHAELLNKRSELSMTGYPHSVPMLLQLQPHSYKWLQ